MTCTTLTPATVFAVLRGINNRMSHIIGQAGVLNGVCRGMSRGLSMRFELLLTWRCLRLLSCGCQTPFPNALSRRAKAQAAQAARHQPAPPRVGHRPAGKAALERWEGDRLPSEPFWLRAPFLLRRDERRRPSSCCSAPPSWIPCCVISFWCPLRQRSKKEDSFTRAHQRRRSR